MRSKRLFLALTLVGAAAACGVADDEPEAEAARPLDLPVVVEDLARSLGCIDTFGSTNTAEDDVTYKATGECRNPPLNDESIVILAFRNSTAQRYEVTATTLPFLVLFREEYPDGTVPMAFGVKTRKLADMLAEVYEGEVACRGGCAPG